MTPMTWSPISRSTSSTVSSFWRKRSTMTSKPTASDIDPTKERTITRGTFGCEGLSGTCAGEMMRASGC
jgi:hypothetical protein